MDILTNPTPGSIPGLYFALSNDPATPDNVQLTVGLLANFPLGLLAFDGDDTVTGSSDGEIIYGNQGRDNISGEDGNDVILAGKDNDTVTGGLGDDFLAGNIDNDIVIGGAGNDTLRGGKNNDVLIGGLGNDMLWGDFGLDGLKGDAGSDVFVLRADNTATLLEIGAGLGDADLIIDFNPAEDQIGLTGGLTEADNIDLIEFTNQPLQLPSDVQSVIDGGFLSVSDFDPDGDGLVSATLIQLNGTSELLGAVLNVTAADLKGRFISIE